MANKLIYIKEVPLKNNCPVCYGNKGLRLAFSQKIVDTKFYKSITSEVSLKLTCKKCNSTIYPVQWTDDIERVVDYQRKAFSPKKTSTYLKKLTWIVIMFVALVVTGIFFTIFYTDL